TRPREDQHRALTCLLQQSGKSGTLRIRALERVSIRLDQIGAPGSIILIALVSLRSDQALMRNGNCRSNIRMYLSSHQALVALTEADEHHLTGAQFHHAETTQRFHVDENIFRAFAARQEAEALGAVEPLDDHALKSARRRNGDMGALRRHL